MFDDFAAGLMARAEAGDLAVEETVAAEAADAPEGKNGESQ